MATAIQKQVTQNIIGAASVSPGLKRLRSGNCEEDCCDFMPLSKRINNLHINNCGSLAYLQPDHSILVQGADVELSAELWLPHCQQVAPRTNPWVSQYSPALGADQNPYYYENNKLLYNLYVERVQRLGHPAAY